MRSHLKRNRCPVCHSTKFGPSCSTCDKRKSKTTGSGNGNGNGTCGRDGACVRNPRANPLTQPTWFIDPVGGSDANSGATLECALRTYTKWQELVGNFTVLCPVDDVLRIVIVNDLPDDDPITFRNFMCPGSTAVIYSERRVVATATILAVTEKNRAANEPYTITANIDWSQYLGLMVRETSTGTRAWIARDLGGGTAHVSEWVTTGAEGFLPFIAPDLTPDPLTIPAPPPAPGQTIEVIDFASVVLSDMTVGYDPSQGALRPDGPPGGLILHNLHIRQPEGVFLSPSMPFVLGSMQTMSAFHELIIEPYILVPPGGFDMFLSNNSYRNVVEIFASNFSMNNGLFLPVVGAPFPGALRVNSGANGNVTGDVTFVGTNNEFGFGVASFQNAGLVALGPISFWNTIEPLVGLPGGFFWWQSFTPTFEESCYVPIWGVSGQGPGFLYPTANIYIEQICPFGAAAPLPSLDTGTPEVFAIHNCGPPVGHAWQADLAQFTPPVPITWANFAVEVCGCNPCCAPGSDGGFLSPPESFPPIFAIQCAEAVHPGNFNGIHFVQINFTPPPEELGAASSMTTRERFENLAAQHPQLRRIKQLAQARKTA